MILAMKYYGGSVLIATIYFEISTGGARNRMKNGKMDRYLIKQVQ